MRFALLCLSLLSSLLAADVTGHWQAQVETDQGSGSPTFAFRQSGETLTGDYAGALGEAKLTGTVKGDAIEFSFEVSPGGEKLKVIYQGTIKSPTSMAGKLSIPGLGAGTFTATKK